jgi:hypothetical protein
MLLFCIEVPGPLVLSPDCPNSYQVGLQASIQAQLLYNFSGGGFPYKAFNQANNDVDQGRPSVGERAERCCGDKEAFSTTL